MTDGLLRIIDSEELRAGGVKVKGNNGNSPNGLVFRSRQQLMAFLIDFCRFGVEQHVQRAERRADLTRLDLAYQRRNHFSLEYELKIGYCRSFRVHEHFEDEDGTVRPVLEYPRRAEQQIQLYLEASNQSIN